jgi:hypothetical protein
MRPGQRHGRYYSMIDVISISQKRSVVVPLVKGGENGGSSFNSNGLLCGLFAPIFGE